jgi:hypothetical protein
MSILQRCLGPSLTQMHALRRRVLLRAVQALLVGRRLTLMDLARAWPGAERVRAPLKCVDRLLSNGHLRAERAALDRAKARWLLRGPRPVIVVDWSDLKRDGRWCLLRAVVPQQRRALTVCEWVVAQSEQNSPRVQRAFLQYLHTVVPAGVQPIVLTDAGFRSDWLRAVAALGWYGIGRLRNNTHVRSPRGSWVPCKSLHANAEARPRDLGQWDIVRAAPWRCRLVLAQRRSGHRQTLTRCGRPSRDRRHLKAAQREREPWLLAVSSSLPCNAAQIVRLYALRMSIEQSFRDLKSHRCGHAFEDSLTRTAPRLAILLLLHALALFAAWIMGSLARAAGLDAWLAPHRTRRVAYSILRLGHETIARAWLPEPSATDWQRIASVLRA